MWYGFIVNGRASHSLSIDTALNVVANVLVARVTCWLQSLVVVFLTVKPDRR